jgi:hypothetical protein
MISLRETTRTVGGMASIRALAQDAGLAPSTSVRLLVASRVIFDKYLEEGGRQTFGQPLGPANPGQVFTQNFEGGTIHWNGNDPPIIEEQYDVTVSYQGLHCFHRTSGPGADEPYVIASVYQKTTPEKSATLQCGPYDDGINGGEGRSEPRAVAKDFPPQHLVIRTVLMEHDEGQPQEVRKAIAEAIGKTRDAALAAAGAAAGSPLPGGVMPDSWKLWLDQKFADVLDGIFGFSDDFLGDDTIELSYSQLRDLADHPALLRYQDGIGYSHETRLFQKDEGEYKVYYHVIVTKRVEAHQ